MDGKEMADELWKSMGLENLRRGLRRVTVLAEQFEGALRGLPGCNKCARLVLLENINRTGNELSGEVINLSVLAATLKDIVRSAEEAQKSLCENMPEPCRCNEKECTCHT